MGQMLQLPSPVEFFDKAVRFAPVRLNLDVKLEKHFRLQPPLDLQAGRGTNPLQHLSPFSNQDAFLAFALAVNRGGNARYLGPLLDTVNHDSSGVWKFLLGFDEHALANDF